MSKTISSVCYKQLGSWFYFLSEQSLRENEAGQKQNEEFGCRCIKFEIPIRHPGKQLNTVVLSQGAIINLIGRDSSSYFKIFEKASFNLHILVPHFPLLPSPPPISKEIDFTLHEMLQYFQFKYKLQINWI